MTEAEWAATTDVEAMLKRVASDRKVRLFADACCHGTDCKAVHTACWTEVSPAAVARHSLTHSAQQRVAGILRDIATYLPVRWSSCAVCGGVGWKGGAPCRQCGPSAAAVALALAAYDDGAVPCTRCDGSGEVHQKNYHGAWDTYTCAVCNGTGRVKHGPISTELLSILSDPLEEAGCTWRLLAHLRSSGGALQRLLGSGHRAGGEVTDQEWLACDDVERMLRFAEKTRTLTAERRQLLVVVAMMHGAISWRGFWSVMFHVAAGDVRCIVPRCREPSHTAPTGMPGPIAADYLEEQGCVDIDLLLHLRSREDHLLFPFCFAYVTASRRRSPAPPACL